MTLGAVAAADVRLIVWCRACSHQVEPDPAEMAQRYGAETSAQTPGLLPLRQLGRSIWW